MRFESPICRCTRLALLAASVAAIGGAAIAQQSTTIPEVQVSASVIRKHADAKSLGAPTETVDITEHVSYADLPLDTNSGRALLRARVEDAAKDACMRIRYRQGPTVTSDADCIRTAINRATPQIDAAIAAAKAPGIRR